MLASILLQQVGNTQVMSSCMHLGARSKGGARRYTGRDSQSRVGARGNEQEQHSGYVLVHVRTFQLGSPFTRASCCFHVTCILVCVCVCEREREREREGRGGWGWESNLHTCRRAVRRQARTGRHNKTSTRTQQHTLEYADDLAHARRVNEFALWIQAL